MNTIRVIVDSVNTVINVADTVEHTVTPVNNVVLDSTSVEYICMALVTIVLIVCITTCIIHLVKGTKSVKCILMDILKNPDKEVSTELIQLISNTIKEKVNEEALKKEKKEGK